MTGVARDADLCTLRNRVIDIIIVMQSTLNVGVSHTFDATATVKVQIRRNPSKTSTASYFKKSHMTTAIDIHKVNENP